MKTLDGGLVWFVHVLKHSVAEASLFLGVSERTVERYISKFLVTGDVKAETIGRSCEETRNVFQLKKKNESSFFFLSSPSRTLGQTFIVGVFIFTKRESNLGNFAYQIA